MLCILYVIFVGTLLGVAALQVERALPQGRPRRWVWCVAIIVSVALPPVYFARHRIAVEAVGSISNVHGGHSGAWAIPAWTSDQSSDTFINRIWIAASCIIALWGLVNAARIWWILATSRKGTVIGGVGVTVTDVTGPATVGLVNPRVLIPRWVLALPGIERGYVLRHEDEHRRARDAALLTLASLTLVLLPWNVALWWLLRRLHLAIEMDCDTRVVAALGDAGTYANLLLRVAEAGSRGPSLQPALLGGRGMLEQRLKTLVLPGGLRTEQRLALAAVAVVLALAVAVAPHPVMVKSPTTGTHISK